MMHELPIFLTGVCVGSIIVSTFWTLDLRKNIRREKLLANRLALTGALIGGHFATEPDEFEEDEDTCRECDAPRGSCRSCQAEHAADQRG